MREYTLEELARMTGTPLETLRKAVKKGTLDARPHRTYLVGIEADETVKSKVLGAIARMTSPVDNLEL